MLRCTCGQARRAALFQVRFWRCVAEKILSIRLGEGSISPSDAIHTTRRLWDVLARAQARIRSSVGELSGSTGIEWFLTWQWLLSVRRRHGSARSTVIKPWCPELEEARAIVVELWPEVAHLSMGWCARQVFFRSRSSDAEDDAIRVRLVIPGLQDRARFALRRWLRAGGRRLLAYYVSPHASGGRGPEKRPDRRRLESSPWPKEAWSSS